MPENFYIADWHYGHANILSYDNRPFKTVEEMNDTLVFNWNQAVTPADTVYVLGDMFWYRSMNTNEAVDILKALYGRKILIRGNHDNTKSDAFTKQFEAVTDYMEIQDRDRNVVLCHYPIVCFKGHFRGWYHLYGHVHIGFEANMMEHNKLLMEQLYEKQCRMYNVGAMMPYMGYTPRTLDHILAHAK